jgi:pimeloyl-ACP methyl ester carboxylesterase
MKMFGALHRPTAEPRGGVIVCSPYQAEFLKNYRREVVLGRALAAEGFAVQRFHYRGSGNSDGDPEDVSFDSMLEDAVAAREWLVARTGVTWTAFVGTRLGGLIAASAAARIDRSALVLWEPVVEAVRYFEEIFRGKLLSELKSSRPSAASPEEELSRQGYVDILGYPITKRVYESAEGRDLGTEVGTSPRRILLVQIGGSRGMRSEYARLVQRWEGGGSSVHARVVDRPQAWWFGGGNAETLGEPERVEALIGTTVRWLSEAVQEDSR